MKATCPLMPIPMRELQGRGGGGGEEGQDGAEVCLQTTHQFTRPVPPGT